MPPDAVSMTHEVLDACVGRSWWAKKRAELDEKALGASKVVVVEEPETPMDADGARRARTRDPQLANSPEGWSRGVSGRRRLGSKPLRREALSALVTVRRCDLTRI